MKYSKRLITQTPECLTEPISQVINVVISSLFALVFLTAYVPFSETAWFLVGKSSYFFITAAFVGSGMMFLALSRILMNWLKKQVEKCFGINRFAKQSGDKGTSDSPRKFQNCFIFASPSKVHISAANVLRLWNRL